MKQSTKILIPTFIIGNASVLYIVFSNSFTELIQNSIISNVLLLLAILGVFFTVIYNIFGGGLLNRKFLYYYINEGHEHKEDKQPWEQ